VGFVLKNMQILDLTFQNNRHFLEQISLKLHLANSTSQKPLIWVAYANAPLVLDAAIVNLIALPSHAARQLKNKKLDWGFHRFYIHLPQHQQAISFTLCIGPLDKTLAQLQSSFNFILANSEVDGWSSFTASQLSRLCLIPESSAAPPYTVLQMSICHEPQAAQLKQAGFQLLQEPDHPTSSKDSIFNQTNCPATWLYQPFFKVKAKTPVLSTLLISQYPKVIVVGAGLCGAITAYLLAQQGLQVTVLEAAAQLGAGASGLPAGLIVAQNNAGPGLAYFTRQGLWATCQLLAQLGLKQGQDYDLSGVLEKKLRANKNQKSSHPIQEEQTKQDWHELAGWIQAPVLIQACLNHPNIQINFEQELHKIEETTLNGKIKWKLLINNQAQLEADAIILTNSTGINSLLQNSAIDWNHDAFQGIAGQVTWAQWPSPFPQQASNSLKPEPAVLPLYPVNGWGHLLPQVPITNQQQNTAFYWLIGATYQPLSDFNLHSPIKVIFPESLTQSSHQANFNKIHDLLGPKTVELLQASLQLNHPLLAWQGIRWVSRDRYPIVGQIKPQLYVCSAMGSRGLSLAALCAQSLVDSLLGHALPISQSDFKRLSPLRFI
jgi:tRNA 5-methylaminomethyl-2-thiouridine biosynthesis bifunctional protein